MKRTILLISVAGTLLLLFLLVWPSELRLQERSPNDPYLYSKGSWEQSYDDQWGLKRIGFTPAGSGPSAWELAADAKHPVIVALIDTGLDYFHPDLNRENVWRNPGEIRNGRDDDGNGYVDDLIGWNFVDNDNNPWDNAGHGTHLAGIIAAATGNGQGIAGINPQAKIMPLKVLNFIGRGGVLGIAEAIFYAVKHGARVINLSLGGEHLFKTEQLAIDYAHKKGVLVVVAAGNVGRDTAGYGPAGLRNVITVAATDVADKRVGFSNWGQAVKIAAPGVDILSLRARRTDLVLVSGGKNYKAGAAFVGPGARYYRTSGTSFAAAFVSGVASLLFSKNPKLTNAQVERMLLMSADDVDEPGWDRLTGYGRLNARKALEADPDYYLYVELHRVAPARERGGTVIQVFGSAAGSHWGSYHLEVGQGDNPAEWRKAGQLVGGQVKNGLLGTLTQRDFGAAGKWTVRVLATDTNGKQRESRQSLTTK